MKTMKKILIAFVFAFIAIAAIACGEKYELKIEGADASLTLVIGESKKVTPTATEGASLVWESSAADVASVEDGTIKGLAAGTATITVYIKEAEDVKATISVKVVNSVKVDKESVQINVGETAKVTATVAGSAELEWASSDETVCTVADGVITAVGEGTAIVTVTVKGSSEKAEVAVTCILSWKENDYVEESDYKAYVKNDLDILYSNVIKGITEDQLEALDAELEAGKALIDNAMSITAVQAAYNTACENIKGLFPLADGIISYMGLSNEEKTDILGILEGYAVTNGFTGISIFENGGYVMYNPRITLGTETYIVGYGFGTLAEGSITAPLASETNPAYKMYYHTFNASDPGTANYLNDQGSEVGDFYGYIGSSLYTTFMNDTKNGYDWVPELAISEKPIPVDSQDGGATAKTWKIEVKTGAKDGLKYNTLSTIPSRQAFNNRLVELEDYITPFKLLLTQANGLYRGSELANTKNGAIKGAKTYYDASKDGFNAKAWENVGVKVFTEDGKNYFQVEFDGIYSQFFAMYYISSSLYAPIPQEFLDLVTVENYLGFNKDATETPVDNSLSLGAYTLEKWENNVQVIYKKNPNYTYATTKYAIEGISIKILPAAKEDATAGIKEFEAGNIDSCGIPQDYLDKYKSDSRTRQTSGDSNFKLNINATNAETWEYLFGENGVVCQTPKDKYWELEPALANRHFTRALGYAIDRLSYAAARGSVPSVNFFSSDYMSDNENGMSYNGTDQHKAAVEQLLTDTDGYGYSLELARDYFRIALAELEAEGAYTPGTVDKPTLILLQIDWMVPQHETNYHNEIKKNLEDAFNHESVSGGKYKLEVKFWNGPTWDAGYNNMMAGQFDLGFGAITGNPLDPLGFMNVLSTDTAISGSFTLNWGVDTNGTDYPIVYNGKRYTYDALYSAATGTAIISEGVNAPAYTFDYAELTKDEAGNYTATATFALTIPDKTTVTVTDIALCNYAMYYELDQYEEYYTTDSEEDGYSFTTSLADGVLTVTVTVSAEYAAGVIQAWVDAGGKGEDYRGYMGFDFYFDLDIDGNVAVGKYESVEDFF